MMTTLQFCNHMQPHVKCVHVYDIQGQDDLKLNTLANVASHVQQDNDDDKMEHKYDDKVCMYVCMYAMYSICRKTFYLHVHRN